MVSSSGYLSQFILFKSAWLELSMSVFAVFDFLTSPTLSGFHHQPILERGVRGEEHEGSRDDSFCKNGYFFWSSTALFHT